jgi:hypothetical protein
MTWLKRQRTNWSRDERESPGGALHQISSEAPFTECWAFHGLGENSMSKAFVVGQYAEGQGGIYIGQTAQGRHLFAAASPLDGEFEFGGYGDDLEGYSDIDGVENTRKLLERGEHSAALAASEYSADGHKDFYLPSHRELLQVVAVEGFNEEAGYVWTSSPYGSFFAWAVDFECGYVYFWVRSDEFRVRPVRSIIA